MLKGNTRIISVNAKINIECAGGSLVVEKINARVNISEIEGAVRLARINGAVQLRFTDDLNANFNVLEYNGNVSSELPNTAIIEKKQNAIFSARIGTGGIPISLASINGSVQLLRAKSTVEQ